MITLLNMCFERSAVQSDCLKTDMDQNGDTVISLKPEGVECFKYGNRGSVERSIDLSFGRFDRKSVSEETFCKCSVRYITESKIFP